MSIKWKLLLMAGVPISAILIILIVGLSSFNIIHGDMSSMNGLHMDRATMIDADRDAYQAQVAILEAAMGFFQARPREHRNACSVKPDRGQKVSADVDAYGPETPGN